MADVFKRRNLYKHEIRLLKVMPCIMATIYFMNTVSACCGFTVCAFSYIAGIGFIPLLFVLISSFVFEFCACHRLFLYYIIIDDIVNVLDHHIELSVDNLKLLAIHSAIAFLFVCLILFFHLKERNK